MSDCATSATLHPRSITTYTWHDKSAALHTLARNNGNVRKSARLIDIPWTTLRGWAKQMPEEYEKLWYHYQMTAREEREAQQPETPDPDALLQSLESKANLLIGALTPERIAEASLPHILRALNTVLPRILALRKSTEDRLAREKADTTFTDMQTQVAFVLRRHIEDPNLLRTIAQDLDHLTQMSDLLEQEDEENELEAAADTLDSAARSPIALGELGERGTSGSPLPRSLSECPGEAGTREAGGGVRSDQNERAISMSELGEREMSEQTLADASEPPLPVRNERPGEGVPNECLHSVGGEVSSPTQPKKPFVPPTLEELLAIPYHTTWAGAA